jgi:quercetin dioxygenase-like cupin family protein
MSDHAVRTIQIDNQRTRVTKWRFGPDATTGYHTHKYDYVIIPLNTGNLGLTGPDGIERFSKLVAGVSYFKLAGVEHDVRNANDHEFSFVEVEFK